MNRPPHSDHRQHARRIEGKWFLIGMAIFYFTMFSSYSLAYGVVTLIYARWFPQAEHTIGREYLTLLFMMQFLGVFFLLVRFVFNPGKHQIQFFKSWIEAMRRMAKGDFNIALDAEPRRLGQLGVLVRSFNEMANGLSEMENMRQEFISNVSHEFQSPLTSIGGFARALQSDDLPPETRLHYLRIIETESARLSKLSDNLLKLTSLESNHHPFEPKPYRLDRQLRRVILSAEPQWQAKNLSLDVDLPETAIAADEDLLSQAWINLLHNAMKFTPDNGTIRFRLEAGNGAIAVEISDTGIGISEEDLPHLFDRFFKADKARSRSAGGSGLGLSIVKKIVELHGGSVTVRSRTGEGSSFRIELPAEAAGYRPPN